MTEIAGDAQDLNRPGRRDTNSDRDIAFNMKLLGLCGVLRLGFKEHLGSALRCRRTGSCWLRHWRRRVLSQVDGAGDLACRVEGAGASGHTMRNACNGYRTIAFHVLSGG